MKIMGPEKPDSKGKFNVGTSPMAEIMRLLGHDAPVAVLAYRIRFWWVERPRVGLHRDGHRWIAFTVDQWLTNSGLTRKQFKRAMALLVRHGLVVTRPDKVSPRQQFFTTFVRPIHPVLTGTTADGDSVPMRTASVGDSVPTGTAFEGHSVPMGSPTMEIEKGMEIEEDMEDAPAVAVAAEGLPLSQEGREIAIRKTDLLPAETSLDDEARAVVAALDSRDPRHVLGALEATAALQPHQAWALAYAVRREPFCRWIGPEWGLAKTLKDAWGDHAATVILLTVVRWDLFRTNSMMTLGGVPLLTSLVKYRHEALAFAKGEIDGLHGRIEYEEREARRRAEDEARRQREREELEARRQEHEARQRVAAEDARRRDEQEYQEGLDEIMAEIEAERRKREAERTAA
jgi:hypothetical protein